MEQREIGVDPLRGEKEKRVLDDKTGKIVDKYGNILTTKRESKLQSFWQKNVWNILGTGLATVITVMGAISFVFSREYAYNCANFYGVDEKYFNGTNVVADKLIFLVCAFLMFLLPFIFAYINGKVKNKIDMICTFFVTVMLLFMQNLIYISYLINAISFVWLKNIIDNYVTVILLLVVGIVIAYFVIIRNYFWKDRKYKKAEDIIFTLAVTIYIVIAVLGGAIRLNYKIDDKKDYEVIDGNQAIVSVYEGKFVVMDCEIQEEAITLKKGSYRLKEMTEDAIKYHKFQKVVCE